VNSPQVTSVIKHDVAAITFRQAWRHYLHTQPDAQHHRPLASIQSYCLVTSLHVLIKAILSTESHAVLLWAIKACASWNAELAYLWEAFRVALNDFRVRTFEFLDDIKTLVELSEHIGNWTREKSVLWSFLELHVIRTHTHKLHTNTNTDILR